ncbi:hypothetical protein N7539_005833 [Penicillium diatomitis]|uniref:NTP binding protein n=1 Tax=Penicillium diatomitis TaxID=2819901 RepID=A0A9W9X537_9EURO|nr:uncharacterized protein N7539_005833 [Penicillium diatomitis]KAJ5484037.1 hypothetical protein N7539_005833 [Penicillium diatomitis]
MEVESRVELPDGHLVNLSPRNQRETDQSQPRYQAYRAEYTVNELSASPVAQVAGGAKPFELGERTPPSDTLYKTRSGTKLPVAKSIRDKNRDRDNETPSPTGIPKPSPGTLSSGGSTGDSAGRQQYWSKIRDRVDRGSPLMQRASYVRSREGDRKRSERYRNYRTCSGPLEYDTVPGQEKDSEESVLPPSPYGACRDQGVHQIASKPEQHAESRPNGDSWVSSLVKYSNSHNGNSTDSTSDASQESNISVSPVSDDEDSADWEDRFVVHMPSAKEPNPPTMTSQEIAEYQQRIEREHRQGRRLVDKTDARGLRNQSPSIVQSSSPPGTAKTPPFIAYEDSSPPLESKTAQQPSPPQLEQPAEPPQPPRGPEPQDYFCPDEIGNHRISTIWEESPSKSHERKVTPPADGSFLGCKEINGDGTRNPDEILLFGSGESPASLQPRPLAVKSKKKQTAEKKASDTPTMLTISSKHQDKNQASEGRVDPIQSSKLPPCSKLPVTTMCRDPQATHDIPRLPLQTSEQAISRISDPEIRSAEKSEGTRGDDDVFIITPTITRTMLPVPGYRAVEKRPSALRPQGLRRQGDVGHSITYEAVKAVRAVPQVVTTPSGLRYTAGKLQSSSKMHSVESLESTKSHVADQTQKLKPAPDDTTETPPLAEKKAKFQREIKFIRSMPLLRSSNSQVENEEEHSQAPSSIRGFIRTTGLARPVGLAKSPTDHLASILRNGTDSIRSRAEAMRKNRKESPVSVPSRENSESSRSELSFTSVNDLSKLTSPPSPWSSPRKLSPAIKVLFGDSEPERRRLSYDKSPRPSVEDLTSTKTSQTAVQSLQSAVKPTPVVAVEETTRVLAESKFAEEDSKSTTEDSKPAKLTRAQRLEKFKEEARIRRAARMARENMVAIEKTVDVAGLAELDGRQVTGRKSKLQPNITDVQDVCENLHELNAREKDDYSNDNIQPFVLTMIFEIVVVAVTSVHRFGLQAITSPYVKFFAVNLASMIRHCYRVSSRIYYAALHYQVSGVWPDMSDDQAVRRFVVDLLQATIYLFVLAFASLLVYRTIGYCYLIGSWFLWLCSPFAWFLNCTTRAIMM